MNPVKVRLMLGAALTLWRRGGEEFVREEGGLLDVAKEMSDIKERDPDVLCVETQWGDTLLVLDDDGLRITLLN